MNWPPPPPQPGTCDCAERCPTCGKVRPARFKVGDTWPTWPHIGDWQQYPTYPWQHTPYVITSTGTGTAYNLTP